MPPKLSTTTSPSNLSAPVGKSERASSKPANRWSRQETANKPAQPSGQRSLVRRVIDAIANWALRMLMSRPATISVSNQGNNANVRKEEPANKGAGDQPEGGAGKVSDELDKTVEDDKTDEIDETVEADMADEIDETVEADMADEIDETVKADMAHVLDETVEDDMADADAGSSSRDDDILAEKLELLAEIQAHAGYADDCPSILEFLELTEKEQQAADPEQLRNWRNRLQTIRQERQSTLAAAGYKSRSAFGEERVQRFYRGREGVAASLPAGDADTSPARRRAWELPSQAGGVKTDRGSPPVFTPVSGLAATPEPVKQKVPPASGKPVTAPQDPGKQPASSTVARGPDAGGVAGSPGANQRQDTARGPQAGQAPLPPSYPPRHHPRPPKLPARKPASGGAGAGEQPAADEVKPAPTAASPEQEHAPTVPVQEDLESWDSNPDDPVGGASQTAPVTPAEFDYLVGRLRHEYAYVKK